MTIDRTGCTRIVLLTSRYAFKIPNFLDSWGEKWRLFLHGLLANQQEWRMWSRGRYPELCPITFYLPFGILVVMPRVRILTDDEYCATTYATLTEREDYCVPAEAKSNSFGWLGDKIVAIDYGS